MPRPRPKTRYRRVSVLLWDDDRFSKLSRANPNAQTLWIYLLTGRHTTALPGLFLLGEKSLAEALAWPLAALRRCLAEIVDSHMAKIDRTTRVVWLPRALGHNPPESPNVVKAWRKAFDEIPPCGLRCEALSGMEAFTKGLGEAFRQAFHEAFAQVLQEGLGEGLDQGLSKGLGAPFPESGTGTVVPPIVSHDRKAKASAKVSADSGVIHDRKSGLLPRYTGATWPDGTVEVQLDAAGLTNHVDLTSTGPHWTFPDPMPTRDRWLPGRWPWHAFHHDCPDPAMRGLCPRQDFDGPIPTTTPCPAHRKPEA